MKFCNLEYYRKKASLSQSELARLSGIPQTTISGWEKCIGEPSVTRALVLSEILNIPVQKIFPTATSLEKGVGQVETW